MQHAAVSLLAFALTFMSAGATGNSSILTGNDNLPFDDGKSEPVAPAPKQSSSAGSPDAVPQQASAAEQGAPLMPQQVAADEDAVVERGVELVDEDEEPPAIRRATMDEICTTIELAAENNDLPLPFFIRLIWQESKFDPDAKSPVGAQGIAQFMPQTAVWRGLADPFDPIASLQESAEYLRELRSQFGNIGLAAAAYNGGSGRVQAWLAGRGKLPRETRDYVRIITGAPVENWRGDRGAAGHVNVVPSKVPCRLREGIEVADAVEAMAIAAAPQKAVSGTAARLWFVQLAAHVSKDKARARSEAVAQKFRSVLGKRKLQLVSGRVAGRGSAPLTQVRVAESSRESAEKLCARLRAGGASCTVLRNS